MLGMKQEAHVDHETFSEKGASEALKPLRLKFFLVTTIMLLALIDSLALTQLHFTFINKEIEPIAFFITVILVLANCLFLAAKIRLKLGMLRLALLIELCALLFTMSPAIVVFSRICTAYSNAYPYADALLLSADKALGYHWEGFAHWVAGNTARTEIMFYAYTSTNLQILFAFALLLITKNSGRLYELFFAVTLGAIVCCLVAMLLPAQTVTGYLHPPEEHMRYFALGASSKFLTMIDGIRNGTFREVDKDHLLGIVTFPSFHAVLGCIMIWVFWPFLYVRPLIIILNMLLMLGSLYVGGHYLVDIIGGALLAGMVIGLQRPFSRFHSVFIDVVLCRLVRASGYTNATTR